MKKLTQKRLKELLHYDPGTGIFTWKINLSNITAGKIAGYTAVNGYVQIRIYKKLYYAHRLVWFYVYGYFPENDIDHIDKIKNHNWVSNLREVSNQCNIRNTGNFKHNTSGIKGVTWCDPNKKWRAVIKINGKKIHIGIYADFNNAVCARLAGEQCYDWNSCDSSSPAFRYVQKYINSNVK